MQSITLLPQEESVHAQFNGQLVMTRGFQDTFKDKAPILAVKTLCKIITDRVKSNEGADYLQVAVVDNIKFWVIDDGDVVTCLLPSEY